MSRNPLSSSERRGIIVLAVLSVLLIASGLWVSSLSDGGKEFFPEEVTVVEAGDSLNIDAELKTKDKNNKKSKKKNKSKNSKKKSYRKRSPNDEPV